MRALGHNFISCVCGMKSTEWLSSGEKKQTVEKQERCFVVDRFSKYAQLQSFLPVNENETRKVWMWKCGSSVLFTCQRFSPWSSCINFKWIMALPEKEVFVLVIQNNLPFVWTFTLAAQNQVWNRWMCRAGLTTDRCLFHSKEITRTTFVERRLAIWIFE